jgi:hypothetical protein
MKIYKKLLTIQQKINGLGKDKATYNYKYVTGDKLLGEIKPMMNDLGLILKQEVLSIENSRQDYELQQKDGTVKHKSEILSKVMMQFTWIDCETGETDVNLFGANGQNDWEKGLGSALTYAERYFLLKYFHIATDEDDIDNDQRKTSAPVQVKQVQPMLDIPRLETRLNACTTIDELGKVYMSFTAAEKQATETLKNQLKEKLTPAK